MGGELEGPVLPGGHLRGGEQQVGGVVGRDPVDLLGHLPAEGVRPRLTPARKPSDPALIRPGLISAKGRN